MYGKCDKNQYHICFIFYPGLKKILTFCFMIFQEPVYVTSEDTIELHVWRLSNGKYIWYEWGLTAPIATSIHNPRGRSYWIGL